MQSFVKEYTYILNAIYYCMWLQQINFSKIIYNLLYIFFSKILFLLPTTLKNRFEYNTKYRAQKVDKFYRDKKTGFCIAETNHWFGYEYSSYPCFISFVLSGLVYKYVNIGDNPVVLLLILAIPMGICYIPAYKAVFSNDRYLKYFKEFEKEDEQWHKKWNRITILFRIGGVLSTIVGIISAICIIKYL